LGRTEADLAQQLRTGVMDALVVAAGVPTVRALALGALDASSQLADHSFLNSGRPSVDLPDAFSAVEAFDEGVLHWLAWCDVVPADLGLISPAKNGIAGQLRAVVADDSLGPAAGADQKIKLTRDPLAGQGGIRHGSQTLAGAVVRNRRPQAN
jgi:hypothetical protein